MRTLALFITLLVSYPAYGGAATTNTCKFLNGPRTGDHQSYPDHPPIPVGSPCHDGAGSSGIGVPDDDPDIALTNTCKFLNGPRAGQTQRYPDQMPIPVGSPCHDGMGSTGSAIAE